MESQVLAEREQQILKDVNCQHELIATGGAGKTSMPGAWAGRDPAVGKPLRPITARIPWMSEIPAEEGEKEQFMSTGGLICWHVIIFVSWSNYWPDNIMDMHSE